MFTRNDHCKAAPRRALSGVFVKMRKALVICAALTGLAAPALAQEGSGPISIVVGYGPGGGNDLVARILAERLTEDMGRPVIVENKPGAAGRIGAEFVANAVPDGTTLLATGNSVISMAESIFSNLSYDPQTDLTPIAVLASYPQLVLVVPQDHPAQTLAELVEWSQANPDSSNYAAVAPAYTVPTEQLKLQSGLVAEGIAYRSSADAMVSVLNGEITFLLGDYNTTVPAAQAGTVRALAVTGSERFSALPDVPSMGELGYPDVRIDLWTGLFAPRGTAPELAAALAARVDAALAEPAVQERLAAIGVTPGELRTTVFAERIATESAEIAAIIEAANLVFE